MHPGIGSVGCVVWFTGLSGAGKTTLTEALETHLLASGRHTVRLDGDILRDGLNRDLRFSPEDRRENVRRLGEVARLFANSGVIALVAAIAPYQEDRAHAREIIPDRFIEVFVDTPLSTCEARDVKGLYARARAGNLAQFTGVSAPYEIPEAPELRVVGDGAIEVALAAILDYLRARGLLVPSIPL